ncbi:MAG: biopolymer transporter ExbD [Deltaproteobacteria bacterium]|nr:biopolymer transporter ExbD [Deltaproteobacteria bacterium]
MRIPSPRTKRRARIEIIPLIDIMFFLLATFMIVSVAMIKNRGIPVNLPQAGTGAAEERAEFTSVTVNKDGDYYFNKERVSFAELEQRLLELKSSSAEPRVFLNGDESASVQSFISALDAIRKAGIVKLAIETKPLPAPKN